jgi:hypothetical protein
MSFVRFIVGVDDPWRVSVTRDGQAVGAPRDLQRVAEARRVWPLPPASELPPDDAELANLLAGGTKQLEELLQRIAQRRPNKGDVAALGKYLFAVLLGKPAWEAIKQAAGNSNVELALRFPLPASAKEDLARFHWEALRGPEDFLARGTTVNGRLLRVAFTRLVPGTQAAQRPVSLPPHALFVVGCELNDARIRPGAEFLGMLRQIRQSAHQRTFHPRVLVRASVEQIKETVATFKPDLVHFICHGTDDGRLEFAPEPGEPADAVAPKLGPENIADLFTKPDEHGQTWAPAIVVLNACNSAIAGGAEQTAPLAARLIQLGIPVVVGMGGRVADTACRLFTRSFGEALCVGRPLVEATELGRRAAFDPAERPETTCDWALPTLFLAERGLAPNFAPTQRELTVKEERIHSITVAFHGNRAKEPCFAARLDELERAYTGLRVGRTALLVVLGDHGFGRTRLLQEIVSLAVRDGHLPVLVSAYYRGGEPAKDLPGFLALLGGALKNTANYYRAKVFADPAEKFQIEWLALARKDEARKKLRPEVEQELDGTQPTVKAMVLALRHDLGQLLAAARAAENSPVNAAGRPLLLLDDLDLLGADVLRGLFSGAEMLVGEKGLGDPAGNPIPLVAAFRLQKESQGLYEDILKKIRAPWADEILLTHFDRQHDEDLSAYQQILLNPHDETRRPGISNKRWVIRDDADAAIARDWTGILRSWVQGIPTDFESESFYNWVQTASAHPVNLLTQANDDDVLKALSAAP